MTSEEKKMFNEMKDLIRELKQSNAAYAESLTKRVDSLESVVSKKHMPVKLEEDILSTVQVSIGEVIQKVLSSYDSPLVKLAKEVIEANSSELRIMINDSFASVIHTSEFKQSIINAFVHKIGRILIDKSGGLLEKTVNDLRQDAVFKAKLSLAVNGIIEDYLNTGKNI